MLYVGGRETGTVLAETDGLHVEVVPTAEDAREQVSADYHCIVIEYSYPDSDGLSFLESLGGTSCTQPVIVFAADGEPIAQEAYEAGATDYVRRTGADDAESVLAQRIQTHAVGTGIVQEGARFLELFEMFPEPTISYSIEDGRAIFRSVNAVFEETFCFSAESVLGDPVDDHIVPERKRDQARNIDQRVKDGERLDETVRRRTATGNRLFHLRNIPVRSDGNIDGYAVYSDITEQRACEREAALERQNEWLGTFAAIVAGLYLTTSGTPSTSLAAIWTSSNTQTRQTTSTNQKPLA